MGMTIREDQLEEFARWVAEEVIDEEMWVLNYLSFAEIACRKLTKLGIIQRDGQGYVYGEDANGNNK